jgi:hypothetical protein
MANPETGASLKPLAALSVPTTIGGTLTGGSPVGAGIGALAGIGAANIFTKKMMHPDFRDKIINKLTKPAPEKNEINHLISPAGSISPPVVNALNNGSFI